MVTWMFNRRTGDYLLQPIVSTCPLLTHLFSLCLYFLFSLVSFSWVLGCSIVLGIFKCMNYKLTMAELKLCNCIQDLVEKV